ncbi:MFS transporter [Neobacillus niacini]|uniref:MFS transporter n=1 Tax=Neobacillus niacini TaxID=86668 RepID=UPI0021CB8D62|nr:MFS transporter [Neobacillus niacini]MCM3764179.1 MFS transporter [Neobacillus niacini]
MNQVNKRNGYFMIIVLWFAYVTFAMNWVAGSSLTPQITMTFFGGPVDPVISQVVNYSITTARVFANILAAVILMRIGPRKAASLAIGLLMMSLVAIYLPNYWAYTAARMAMGLGGSMVIVYMNPVVSRYITNGKEKLRINSMNTVSYNVGAFIVSILFTFFAHQLTQDWQLTLTVFAALTAVTFIAWLLLAENFETQSSNEGIVVNYSYKEAFKDPFIWKYALAFSGFLTLYILSLVSLKPVFEQYTQLSGSLINLLVSGAGIIGTFVGAKMGNKGTPRKPILLTSGAIMIASFGLTIALGNTSPVASYSFAFISGFAMFIQYPIFMNLPHELGGMSPQKLTVIFGLFWAIAYASQTIITITWSAILGSAGYVPAMIFFLAASSLYVLFTSFLPETKQKGQQLKESSKVA